MLPNGADHCFHTTFIVNDHTLTKLPEELQRHVDALQHLDVSYNLLETLPIFLGTFHYLKYADFSNNLLDNLPEELGQLMQLEEFHCRNNRLKSLSIPKSFGQLVNLKVVNFGGNQLTEIPLQLYELYQLEELYLGGNEIFFIHADIEKLSQLLILYLGGNHIRALPDNLCRLRNLRSCNLSDNRIDSLPASLGQLVNLRSLSLHGNLLQALPPEIITLTYLQELSLRGNPLVDNFVRNMHWEVPSLKELAGRCIRVHGIAYSDCTLPQPLLEYLTSARECVNPNCRGVYFTHCAQKVDFVDFCGKYRLPLWRYLCNPSCCETHPRHCLDVSREEAARRQQRVLLG